MEFVAAIKFRERVFMFNLKKFEKKTNVFISNMSNWRLDTKKVFINIGKMHNVILKLYYSFDFFYTLDNSWICK